MELLPENEKMLVCRICAPETEIKHVLRLIEGKKEGIKVWTCGSCGNQKREEKDDEQEPSNYKKTVNEETGETRIGNDEEGIIITNVPALAKEGTELPEEVCKALGLRKVYRMVGTMLESKIPLFELIGGEKAHEHNLYLTKYDLIASPGNDLLKTKKWCIYIEMKVGDKEVKGGAYISDELITDIGHIEVVIREIKKALEKKYATA